MSQTHFGRGRARQPLPCSLAAPASRSPSAGLTSCLLASAGTLSPAQRGHGAGVRGSAGAWCSRAGAQCGSDGLFIQQLASAGAPSLASCMCFFWEPLAELGALPRGQRGSCMLVSAEPPSLRGHLPRRGALCSFSLRAVAPVHVPCGPSVSSQPCPPVLCPGPTAALGRAAGVCLCLPSLYLRLFNGTSPAVVPPGVFCWEETWFCDQPWGCVPSGSRNKLSLEGEEGKAASGRGGRLVGL